MGQATYRLSLGRYKSISANLTLIIQRFEGSCDPHLTSPRTQRIPNPTSSSRLLPCRSGRGTKESNINGRVERN